MDAFINEESSVASSFASSANSEMVWTMGASDFSFDLKAAETKEDILVLLTNVSRKFDHEDQQQHDQSVRNGTARQLLRQLHCRLVVTDKPPYKNLISTERIVLEESRALQMSILLSAIDLILRCSDKVLQANITQLSDDLSCMPRIVDVFSAWRGEATVKLVTLSCTVRIMRRVGPFMALYLRSFTKSLLSLLDNASSPSDIRIDAACAIASYLGKSSQPRYRAIASYLGKSSQPRYRAATTGFHGGDAFVALQVEREAAVIISILSTAIMTTEELVYLEDVMTGLMNIVQSPSLFPKLRKRRCAVLAVCKQLSNPDKAIRKLALELGWAFLSQSQAAVADRVSAASTDPSGIIEKNLDSLVAAFQKNVVDEADAKLQMYGIRALGQAMSYNLMDAARTSGVMKALCRVAKDGDNDQVDEVIMEASMCYLVAASRAKACREIIGNIGGFVTSPYANVRKSALNLLKDISFWNPRALVEQMHASGLLDNCNLIITCGSDEDCMVVTQICRQLVLEDDMVPQLFCSHSTFLTTLVSLVTKAPVTNRPAFINAVEVVLVLMQSDDKIPYFLEFIDLLPWLVSFANRTADEEVKEKLISTIIRFASAKLK